MQSIPIRLAQQIRRFSDYDDDPQWWSGCLSVETSGTVLFPVERVDPRDQTRPVRT